MVSHDATCPMLWGLLELLADVEGRKIAPPHGGFESRFKYLYVESTSTTRTKLLNLRVKPPCGLVATHVYLLTFCGRSRRKSFRRKTTFAFGSRDNVVRVTTWRSPKVLQPPRKWYFFWPNYIGHKYAGLRGLFSRRGPRIIELCNCRINYRIIASPSPLSSALP